MKKLLTIQSLSTLGRSGLAVMGPVISALGCQCCPLPTVALSTHTGFPNPERVSFSDAIPRYWNHYARLGVEFEGILTGYFAAPEQIAQAEALTATELFMVDPILGDHGKFYTGMGPAQAAGLRRLCAKAVSDLQRGRAAYFHKVTLCYKCNAVCQTDSINIPVLWQKVKSPLAVKRNAGQPADCPALRSKRQV